MTNEELKDFVKAKFNLTETTSNQSFATATLEDGTKITNDKGSEFADGDKVFVEIDGELKPAPEGDHITESGITITLDGDSIITGMKRPDEEGEGSEGLAEEMPAQEEMAEEVIEEVVMEETPGLEEIISVIADVVEEKMMEIKEKMKSMEDKMASMEEKMSAFSADSADEKTIPNKKFSKSKPIEVKHNANRYEKLLAKVSNK